MNITLEQAVMQLKNIPKLLESQKQRIQTVAVFSVSGVLLNRIFLDGKATSGGLIGPTKATNKTGAYSEKYGKLRASKGRETSKVNLEFNQDLSKSLTQGVDADGNVVLGINNAKQTSIMAGHERYYGKEITKPTEQEFKVGRAAFISEVNKIVKEVVQGGASV